MRRTRIATLTLVAALLLAPLPAFAQEPATADEDGSSERVEESDEAFRRRMELEDARHRDPGYTPPSGSTQKKQEKIDALPPASRDNIRDQLVDIVMQNDAWEPRDALEEYPYKPTEAAHQTPGLLQREQEAWDEQIAKYHEREAAAFHEQRSAAAAAGQMGAEAGGEADGGQAGGRANGGMAGGEAGESSSPDGAADSSGAADSFSPYAVRREDGEDSPATAGTQQSALDFLRSQGGQAATAARVPEPTAEPDVEPTDDAASARPLNSSETGPGAESVSESELPGVIAIEDLDKLEGTDNEDAAAEGDGS